MKKKTKRLLIFIVCVFIAIIIGVLIAKPKNSAYTNPENIPLRDGEFVKEYPDLEDEDNDGLLNGEEKKLKTSITKRDTDGDTISDYTEVKEQHTDPLKPDTDKDGISDGCELEFQLNPLESKTDGKTLDSKRNFNMEISTDICTLNIEGNANIADTYINILEYKNIAKVPGIIGETYEFHLKESSFQNASLIMSYKEEDLKASGCKEESLSIYQVLNDGSFCEIKSTLHKDSNTIVAEIKISGKYVLADKTVLNNEVIR